MILFLTDTTSITGTNFTITVSSSSGGTVYYNNQVPTVENSFSIGFDIELPSGIYEAILFNNDESIASRVVTITGSSTFEYHQVSMTSMDYQQDEQVDTVVQFNISNNYWYEELSTTCLNSDIIEGNISSIQYTQV